MFEQLHEEACQKGLHTYRDPATGYTVMTQVALLKQGACCGNACRHCPYGHIEVSNPQWKRAIQLAPAILNPQVVPSGEVDVLFWSGGKDSLLSWYSLHQAQRPMVLLTTFDPVARLVPIQNIPIEVIKQQADWLGLPLCLVPLRQDQPYSQVVREALGLVEHQSQSFVSRLVFGDLHLADIRQWRVAQLNPYEVHTPLFGQDYNLLLSNLWHLQCQYQLDVRLSTAIDQPQFKSTQGAVYDVALVQALRQAGLDAMLEKGEGHTVVIPCARSSKPPVY